MDQFSLKLRGDAMTKKIACALLIGGPLVAVLPAHRGLADPSVTVVNPATNPARTSSVDEPGRAPYQFFKNLQPCSGGVCQVTTPTVPAGKRLVVQHVSAFGALTSPGNFVEVVVSSSSSVLSTFAPPLFGNPAGAQGFAFDQIVQGYVDAGSEVTVFISTNGSFNNAASDFVVTGYLIDCTVNECAPIAP
jgi:hypothetical protein